MKVGDLVMCKILKRYGVIMEEPRYLFEGHRRGTSLKHLKKETQYTMVLWDDGTKAKWATDDLEVIDDDRRSS